MKRLLLSLLSCRRRLLAIFVVPVLTATAGVVFAYWTTSGFGSGAATVGSASSITLEAASGTPSSALSPGGTANLLVQLTNPNSYTVTIVGVAQNGTTVTPVGGSSCNSGNAGVSVPTQTGLNIGVAAGAHVVVEIPGGAAMSPGSDNGCQGASFQIPITLTVQQ